MVRALGGAGKASTGPVALIIPLDEEFAPYKRLFPDMKPVEIKGSWEIYETTVNRRRLLFILSDCGPANAGASAERLIAEFTPSVILHGGSAGGLNANLLPGDIVVGNKYVVLASKETVDSRRSRGLHPSLLRYRKNGKRIYMNAIDADNKLLSLAWEVILETLPTLPTWNGPAFEGAIGRPPKFVVGIIGSADTWTTSIAEVERLNAEYGAECEDMETAYVAQICSLHDIPFLAIRAISDNELHHQLDPTQVNSALAAAGEIAARLMYGVVCKLTPK